MAEGFAKKYLNNHFIKSAGTNPQKINPHAIKVMEEVGINISNHKSTLFTNDDLKQKELQKNTAEKISVLTDDIVFIDTHAFITTTEGFYPGLPNQVIQIIQPTHFIAISARPEEIYNRRMKDETRNRDKISIESIKKELAIQDSMLSTCSVLSGSPMKVILNNEGKIEEAANNVIKAIGV